MNWGLRLMVVYLLFVGGIISMAVLSFRQPLDMENENYYEAEKEQDARMQQRALGNTFRPLIRVRQEPDRLLFDLPQDITDKPDLEGTLRMTRPSDARLDVSVSFSEIENNVLSVHKSKLKTGYWKYALEWSHAYGHYLLEDTLTIR